MSVVNSSLLGALAQYISYLTSQAFIREHSQILYEFLEISLLPLPDGPKKYKEGYLKKRTGGRYRESLFQVYCGVFCRRWLRRWFIINNEGILYIIDSNSTRVREMLLFDQSFKIEYGRKATGTKVGITLITPTRKLNLQAYNLFQALDWILAINEAKNECPYISVNRFMSFAPLREPKAHCKWYVDGENYFSDVCDDLLQAKKEVFIADWWLSPEFHLKRPFSTDTKYRLDMVLAQIARRGVQVYIIVYREVKMALYNDSEYTKTALESLSPNIRVLRHPKNFLFIWSHHEKLVIIDQTIGFLGGLDLCYGRMDMNSHPLSDPAFLAHEGETFPGIDYVNPRIMDFRNVKNYHASLIDKLAVPRMPWHDIAVKVVGDSARDLARHFIQYWNFAKIDLVPKKEQYFLTPTTEIEAARISKGTGDESPKRTLKEKLSNMLSLPRNFKSLSNNTNKNDDSPDRYQRMSDMSGSPMKHKTQFDEYVEAKMHELDEIDIKRERPNASSPDKMKIHQMDDVIPIPEKDEDSRLYLCSEGDEEEEEKTSSTLQKFELQFNLNSMSPKLSPRDKFSKYICSEKANMGDS